MRLRAETLFLLAGASIVLATCTQPGEDETAFSETGRLSVATSLGGTDPAELEGYSQALEPRTLEFPEDHGPHPDFKTEWWYWIGNLVSAEGRRFGYQLTFFRSALVPPPDPAHGQAPPASEEAVSNWSTRQLYMAHFAITDVDGAGFRSFERFARGAAGLAGVHAEPFRVWLEDWSVAASEALADEWIVRARDGGHAIELSLSPLGARVFNGDRGLSRKGESPGSASYYYSRPRVPTRGRITADGYEYEVRGDSWFDREWSTSLLADDEVGWDWLGLRLADGRALMFFRLRRRDGSSAGAGGTLIAADGGHRELRTRGFELVPQGTWTSPATGVAYPAALRLELPGEDLALEVRPLLADQELRHSFVYWEGAVEVSGTTPGLGYLEMTGYGDQASPF